MYVCPYDRKIKICAIIKSKEKINVDISFILKHRKMFVTF